MKKRVLWTLAISILLVVLAITGCSSPAMPTSGTNELTVKVLDVGQGDAILLRTGEKTTLVDTGDVPARERLVKYLRQLGVKEIDNLIITHPHADHLGGVAAIFDNFAVKQIYDSGQTTTTGLYRQYLQTVKKQKIPFTVVSPGMKIDLGGGAILEILAPQKPLIQGTDGYLNNNSIVGKLVYGNFSMLLTGDIEREAEQRLVAKYKARLKSTVLKSPHHGSRTSSTKAFLQAVSPEVTVISVGAHNDYKHPHSVVLNRYAALPTKVYRTDKDGTITITTNGIDYKLVKEK